MAALFKLTLKELQDKFTSGDITAVDIARSYFLRLSQVEPKVKAYVTVSNKDLVLDQAEALDGSLKGWRKTKPLMAMPLAIKDNICTDGMLTTCGSKMLESFVPPYDATVLGSMHDHQFLLLGKTN